MNYNAVSPHKSNSKSATPGADAKNLDDNSTFQSKLNHTDLNKMIHAAGHDLRSPLFVIRSYTQLLKKTKEQEKVDRGFDLMSDATYKMENIINSLVGLIDVYSLPKPTKVETSFEEVFNEAKYNLVNEISSFDPIIKSDFKQIEHCLLYTSPSPRDQRGSRMPSSA